MIFVCLFVCGSGGFRAGGEDFSTLRSVLSHLLDHIAPSQEYVLTLKAPIMTAADDSLE